MDITAEQWSSLVKRVELLEFTIRAMIAKQTACKNECYSRLEKIEFIIPDVEKITID